MPKVKKSTKYIKGYSERNVEDAINAINNGIAQRQASKQYGVPRATLQFRMSSAFTKTTPGPPPVIGLDKENQIVEWISDCHEKGFPRRKENVQASIKSYLDQSNIKTPFKDNCPGNGWYKNFLRRHPSLSERFAEGVTAASSCVSESDVRNWFRQIENYLTKENYLDILNDPSRIFNSDETYFQVCPKLKYVLAPRGARNVYEVDKGSSKLNLTVLFTFSAKGITTPPTMVFPYKRLPSVVGQSVPEGWGIGVTDSGYMCGELFSDYLQNIFHPYLLREKIPLPVILFVDGHSSHISLELSNLCSELQIILICLYPNSTRLLQPADVAAFKPLKNMWKKSVLEWRKKNPTENMTLDKMGPLLKTAVDNFSPDGKTIQNGFKACGLYPWNPNAVNYSKCLGTSVKSTSNNNGTCVEMVHMQNNSPALTSIINYDTFKKLVGPVVMNKIYLFQPGMEEDESSPEFLILYKLWQEFQKNNLNDELHEQSKSPTQEIKSCEPDKDLNIQTSRVCYPNLELSQNVENIDIQQCVIIDDSAINVILDDNSSIIDLIETDDSTNFLETNKSKEIEEISDIEVTSSINLDNTSETNLCSTVSDNTSSTVNNSSSTFIGNLANEEELTLNNNNLALENQNFSEDELTLNNNSLAFEDQNLPCDKDVSNDGDKTNTNTETDCDMYETGVLDLSLTHKKNQTKAFHEFLEKPPILMRKGKKFTERTSYALSSNEWKANEIKKIEKQKQELKNKELRKIAAAEKKKLAEKEKAFKKQVALQKKQEKQEFLNTLKNMKQEKRNTNVKDTKVNKSNVKKKANKSARNVIDQSRVLNDISNLVSHN